VLLLLVMIASLIAVDASPFLVDALAGRDRGTHAAKKDRRGDRGAAPHSRAKTKANDKDKDRGRVSIVVLANGADPEAAAREMGVEPIRVYEGVFSGFAAELPAAAASRSSRNRRVKGILPEIQVRGAGEIVPSGVRRVGVDYPGATGSGRRDRAGATAESLPADTPGADVAILDSGVTQRGDLPVAGGVSCIEDGLTCSGGNYGDVVGHGTHIAGIVAARDNTTGVVGIAPTSRIWSVRVLGRDAKGRTVGWMSDVLAGLDWVYQQRATIDVVNMSLGGWAYCPGECEDGYRSAIRRVVEAGIPVVVAAGNAGRDILDYGDGATRFVPAAYPETIAVSTFADGDGRPGGAGRTCDGARDDTFWRHSNHGAAVDIAAPGICIRSTGRRKGTVVMSGTSMAAPHVSGALATFFAANPDADAQQARTWLLTEAAEPQDAPVGFQGDPDASREPVLYLGT
jgi:subtilisin family serine protease